MKENAKELSIIKQFNIKIECVVCIYTLCMSANKQPLSDCTHIVIVIVYCIDNVILRKDLTASLMLLVIKNKKKMFGEKGLTSLCKKALKSVL